MWNPLPILSEPRIVLADFYRRHGRVWLATAMASIAVSAWCLYADPIINEDGIRYVRAAELYADARWRDALTLYKWPLYPLTVGMFSAVSGLPASWSAHLLDAALGVLLVSGFLLLVDRLGGKDRVTMVIAAILITLLPALNHYRSFIIRDFGYLAAYLWSLVMWIRYQEDRSPAALAGWLSAAVTAMLFRIEGLAFLLLPPLLRGWRTVSGPRARGLSILAALLAAAGLVAVFAMWLAVSESGMTPGEVLRHPAAAVTAGLRALAQVWGGNVEDLRFGYPGGHAASGSLVYSVVALATLVGVVVKQLGVVHAPVSGWALWKGWAFPNREAARLWWQFVLVNLLVLAGFTLARFTLPGRYTLALVLTLLAAAPFALARWYAGWRAAPPGAPLRRWFPVLLVLLALEGVRGLDVFTGKHYLREAGLWLRGNTPPAVRLFSDNQVLIYFSGKPAYREAAAYDWPETLGILSSGAWRSYDYLALVTTAGDPGREAQARRWLGRPPVHTVAGPRGERVLIFKTPAGGARR